MQLAFSGISERQKFIKGKDIIFPIFVSFTCVNSLSQWSWGNVEETMRTIPYQHINFTLSKPVAVAEWTACPATTREVSRSNPSNLPLLQMWHVGNTTGHHAIYTLIQCTPLLVEKAGVAPDVTFRITAHKQERVQARYPLWIWIPWGWTHKVQKQE